MSTKEQTMNDQQTPSRLGAACGIAFPVALFTASGHHAYPLGLIAIILFAPFAAYLHSLLRRSEGADGWLSTAALGAGLIGITVKIVSVVPELAKSQTTKSSTLYTTLDHMAGMATVISLWPLALMLAIIALLTLRNHALPRPLGYFAALTAIALAVNGSFLHADFVPALLLFLLWTLVTSIVLLRNTRRVPATVSQTKATVTA
jgi:hypothetical protein